MSTEERWEIMPCPVHRGKHPYHDRRWIVTKGTEVEFSSYVPNDWTVRGGDLICELRDHPTAERANLIAAAPELLEALYIALPFVEDALDSEVFKQGIVKRHVATIRAAIAKAEGKP